jgi:hypothetical protein
MGKNGINRKAGQPQEFADRETSNLGVRGSNPFRRASNSLILNQNFRAILWALINNLMAGSQSFWAVLLNV